MAVMWDAVKSSVIPFKCEHFWLSRLEDCLMCKTCHATFDLPDDEIDEQARREIEADREMDRRREE